MVDLLQKDQAAAKGSGDPASKDYDPALDTTLSPQARADAVQEKSNQEAVTHARIHNALESKAAAEKAAKDAEAAEKAAK